MRMTQREFEKWMEESRREHEKTLRSWGVSEEKIQRSLADARYLAISPREVAEFCGLDPDAV